MRKEALFLSCLSQNSLRWISNGGLFTLWSSRAWMTQTSSTQSIPWPLSESSMRRLVRRHCRAATIFWSTGCFPTPDSPFRKELVLQPSLHDVLVTVKLAPNMIQVLESSSALGSMLKLEPRKFQCSVGPRTGAWIRRKKKEGGVPIQTIVSEKPAN